MQTSTAAAIRESLPASQLFQSYQALMQAEPRLRARELAQRLGVSEGELLACRQGIDAWQLEPVFQDLLNSLEAVGRVMALTRNDQAVHERHGIYSNVSFSGEGRMGLVLNPDIDLRLFMQQWYCVFAVIENDRHSLQFFSQQGVAVHKVYRTEETDGAAWEQLVEQFRLPEPQPLTFTAATTATLADQLPEAFDVDRFRLDWAALRDVHEYHALLRKHRLSRTQALQQIGDDWAWHLPTAAAQQALTLASQRQCEVMVFVGNGGCIQIHSGPVSKLLETGPWFNVLDPDFNLHLRVDQIADIWAIERPSTDGIITSIECFNAAGESIMTLFGKRKPGQPELTLWRDLVAQVKQSQHAVVA
ncbi:hemin-degrading factor [Pokkaliibacter plantistimulans]|uniref:Hemin-degrading factor n=1 Tax=Proteobacteria bacterium 228 TaxID=2083153 RepID=A0A2S5KN58_9PROT|nr:ChuX/HutX family heme-like substrate-binding protein [Pokkaliibacter plantistimulans]PPC76152.1 hemin-degrading factor [Pokkaliibacter plantistimulans]